MFETVVYDQDRKKLENWKVLKRNFPQIAVLLCKKYGLEGELLKIIAEEGIVKRERDLDWAK